MVGRGREFCFGLESQHSCVLGYTNSVDMSAQEGNTTAVHLILETGQEFKEVPVQSRDLALGEFLDQVLKALEVHYVSSYIAS